MTFNVAADIATDGAGNRNTAAIQQTVQVNITGPSVTISGAPSGVQNSAFDVTITFSESVTGFAVGDIPLTGTAGASASLSGSGTTYAATITPDAGADGTVKIQVPANAAQNAASNGNTVSNMVTVQVDRVPPTVTLTNVPSAKQYRAFDITITFSEPVTGFTDTDIAFTGAATATATLTGSGPSYTATITPNGEGDLNIQVPANVALDTANNPNSASDTHAVPVDTIGTPIVVIPGKLVRPGEPTAGHPYPMITIYKADGTVLPNIGLDAEILTSTDPETDPIRFDVVIEFDKPVTGFEQEDFYLSAFRGGESIEQWIADDDGMRYTAKIKATQNGGVTFWVPANVAQAVDNGYWNVISVKQTVPVRFDAIVEPDNEQPHVMIEVPSEAQTGAFGVTVVFNEPVYGFTKNELLVTGSAGASITNWDSQPTWDPQLAKARYTATITPTQNGQVIFNVPADVAQDVANWWNTAAMEVVVPIMMNAGNRPTVRIIPPDGVERGPFFVVTVEFSEPVTGFVQDELLCTGTAEISLLQFRQSSDRRSYTVSCQPVRNGMLIVGVNENVAHSDSNSNLLNHPAEPVEVLIWPEDVNQDGDVDIFDAFEVVTHFGQTVVGERNGNPDVNRDGVVNIVDFQQVDAYLEAIRNPPDSSDSDSSAMEALRASYQTLKASDNSDPDFQYALQTLETYLETEDIDPPGVSISGFPSGVQNGTFEVTITFTEAVSDFVQGDLLLTGTATASITAWRANSDNTVYTATITPTTSGEVTLRIPADVATDAAGNPNTAATSQTVTVDVDNPTVSIDVPSGTQTGAFDATITFSEQVNLTGSGNITTSNSLSRLYSLSGDGTTYTATFYRVDGEDGNVILKVPAGFAKDNADNLNTESGEHTVPVDWKAPTVTVAVPSGTQNGAFNITITFSEIVTGFTASDITLTTTLTEGTGNATATLKSGSDGDTEYTAEITPPADAEGQVDIQVQAAVAQDNANQDNTISNKLTVAIDTKSPTVTITGPTTTQSGEFDVTITFTESVSGFVSSDVSLTGSAASITGWRSNSDNTVYTVTITPTASGAVTVSVAANLATDAAGNPNTAAPAKTVTIDVDAPMVTIGVPSGTQTSTFNVTITFTETVSGFTQSDISLMGSAASITGWRSNSTNTVYTATITPMANGTVIVSVAANVATDAAGNKNTAAISQTIAIALPETTPDPATWMPDANLRVAVRSALGIASDADFSKADLNALTSLHAVQAGVTSLTGLEYATNLTSLVAWQNQISNLTPIQNLMYLTEIRIGNNDISSVSSLSGLTSLTRLGLQRNDISSVTPLSNLVNLTWLRLAGNPISDFSPLSSLPNLTDVDVDIPEPDTEVPGVSISVPSGVQTGAFDVTITFRACLKNHLIRFRIK